MYVQFTLINCNSTSCPFDFLFFVLLLVQLLLDDAIHAIADFQFFFLWFSLLFVSFLCFLFFSITWCWCRMWCCPMLVLLLELVLLLLLDQMMLLHWWIMQYLCHHLFSSFCCWYCSGSYFVSNLCFLQGPLFLFLLLFFPVSFTARVPQSIGWRCLKERRALSCKTLCANYPNTISTWAANRIAIKPDIIWMRAADIIAYKVQVYNCPDTISM